MDWSALWSALFRAKKTGPPFLALKREIERSFERTQIHLSELIFALN